jgi:hypothetical protein
VGGAVDDNCQSINRPGMCTIYRHPTEQLLRLRLYTRLENIDQSMSKANFILLTVTVITSL